MELIAELRWQGSAIPMLIVTAAVLDEVMFVQHGASAVMAKPLDLNALVAWLKNSGTEAARGRESDRRLDKMEESYEKN